MAAELSEALSTILDRPKENIHILFEPPGAGRIAFGGELLLDR
jgi:phenylpyruvate tautomerase PptA (4-oxalocrotonate tautomerase family)